MYAVPLWFQACLQTVADLADAVSRDPRQRRHVPDNGAVHPLASNVLRGVKRIMRFRRGYEELAQGAQMPWDSQEVRSGFTPRLTDQIDQCAGTQIVCIGLAGGHD